MATPKKITENPKITDQILFELDTTDTNGSLINPFRVDRILIYYLSRDFTSSKFHELDTAVGDQTITTYFNRAQVVKVFGNDEFPAWLSTDTTNALIEKVGTGEFELLWTPEFAREGDYIVCWTWTPLIASDKISDSIDFFLQGDTSATTSIPSHLTDPDKYPTLLERYLPEHVKLRLSDTDLTPTTLDKLNLAVGDGFTYFENLANQAVDLLDANAVHERMLLFLSNMFNLNLRSTDPTLWRRQIKNAVPLFKKKGTLEGIKQALAQAGITFQSFTQLWQATSPFTWQEAFTVTGTQTQFELAKTVSDTVNFDLSLRLDGSSTYTTLTASEYATITFDSDDCVYLLNWIGDTATVPITLSDGDIVRITYRVVTITDTPLENYIRSLPLLDQRDEATVTFPPKNWNVYLIEETDSMFDAICPTRHPLSDPVVFGKVRTEFPYSENIYNMDEYNGSVRDSTNPCDMDKDFAEECGCCISSYFNIDVEIEGLSTDRMAEALSIINEYKPFHSTIHQLNIQGGINEFILPQQENIEMLIQMDINETLVNGNDKFTRVIEDGLTTAEIERTFLATAGTPTAATGSGTNEAITLYSPGVRFEETILGLDSTDNLLEILSGPDTGSYTVTNPGKVAVDIVQGTPDTIGFPLNSSSFTFRLSNELFDSTITSIAQDDKFVFSDANAGFRLSDVQAGWKIVVTAPAPLAGTYIISESFPDDTLVLASWPVTTDSTGISYQLTTDADADVGDPSTTGAMTVERRGLVDGGTDFRIRYQVKQGDYLRISGTQYQIIEFVDDDNFYISGWTSGAVGVTAAQALRRLLDNAVGLLDVRGMTIDTSPTNYETTLSISNGANALGPLLENNQFKENFLILFEGKYYAMTEIDGTTITISGPKRVFGLAGEAISFDIIQFSKEPQTVQGHDFEFIDRRNGDIVEIVTTTTTTTPFMMHMLNWSNSGSPVELQQQKEGVSIEVEWK